MNSSLVSAITKRPPIQARRAIWCYPYRVDDLHIVVFGDLVYE